MTSQSPTDYKARLAEQLRALVHVREASRADLMQVLGCSESKIGKILRGDVAVAPLELAALLDHLGVTGDERVDLEHLGEEARRRRPKTPYGKAIPDRLRKFFNTEETARGIESFRADLWPGLIQTPLYARAVISTNSTLSARDVDLLVQARQARQERLHTPNPPELTLVITEEAIRRIVGSPEVTKEQLMHAQSLATRPHITIRVLPTSAGLTGALLFPFTIFTRPGERQKTVYVETLIDGLHVDEESRVARYEAVFKDVLQAALAPEETEALLDSVSSQL